MFIIFTNVYTKFIFWTLLKLSYCRLQRPLQQTHSQAVTELSQQHQSTDSLLTHFHTKKTARRHTVRTHSISSTSCGSLFCLQFSDVKNKIFLVLTTMYCFFQRNLLPCFLFGTDNQPSSRLSAPDHNKR